MNALSLVFPGQGSQSLGMLADWSQSFSVIKATFNEASDVLGYDLWSVVQEGPLNKLNETQYTQVAMLTADVALYRILQQRFSFHPQMMAGHSLGEYAALVASNSLDFVDAVYLVQNRALLMQQTVPLGLGSMAAIVGLTDELVQDLCVQASANNSSVMPANYNAIGQVVVAGHSDAIDRLISLAQANSARLAIKIPVSVPCHCVLLNDAAMQFKDYLKNTKFNVPCLDVLSNVDAESYKTPEDIRHKLEVQLYLPVQWVKTIQKMSIMGVSNVIECGPGQVLSGLIKRIERTLQCQSMLEPASLEKIALWCES